MLTRGVLPSSEEDVARVLLLLVLLDVDVDFLPLVISSQTIPLPQSSGSIDSAAELDDMETSSGSFEKGSGLYLFIILSWVLLDGVLFPDF